MSESSIVCNVWPCLWYPALSAAVVPERTPLVLTAAVSSARPTSSVLRQLCAVCHFLCATYVPCGCTCCYHVEALSWWWLTHQSHSQSLCCVTVSLVWGCITAVAMELALCCCHARAEVGLAPHNIVSDCISVCVVTLHKFPPGKGEGERTFSSLCLCYYSAVSAVIADLKCQVSGERCHKATPVFIGLGCCHSPTGLHCALRFSITAPSCFQLGLSS